MIRRGTIGVAISWEWVWVWEAPAFSPWFLKIRMYLNRLSFVRSWYRCLYAVMISWTWKSLSSFIVASCSGVSTITSWAPTPFTEWKSCRTRRWTSPSASKGGNVVGARRIHPPAPFLRPSFRDPRLVGWGSWGLNGRDRHVDCGASLPGAPHRLRAVG